MNLAHVVNSTWRGFSGSGLTAGPRRAAIQRGCVFIALLACSTGVVEAQPSARAATISDLYSEKREHLLERIAAAVDALPAPVTELLGPLADLTDDYASLEKYHGFWLGSVLMYQSLYRDDASLAATIQGCFTRALSSDTAFGDAFSICVPTDFFLEDTDEPDPPR